MRCVRGPRARCRCESVYVRACACARARTTDGANPSEWTESRHDHQLTRSEGGGLGRTQSSAGKKVESTVDGWTNIVEGHDRETNSPRTSSFAPNPPVPLCPCTPRPPATARLSPGYHRTALYPVRPWVRWQGPHGRKGGEGRVDRVCVHGRTGSGAPVLLPPVRLRALSNLLTYIISGGRMRRRISENNTRRAGLRTLVERPRNIAQRLLF